MRYNSAGLDDFAEFVKGRNHTGLWDTELAWYSLNASHWICRVREVDEPHWTVRCRTCLILSDCYSLDLPSSWSWRTILDCAMPSSPDTHWMLLTGFAEFVKVTNHTGLWDAELAWYSLIVTHWICLVREVDEPYWTVRCRACLILFECYSLDCLLREGDE